MNYIFINQQWVPLDVPHQIPDGEYKIATPAGLTALQEQSFQSYKRNMYENESLSTMKRIYEIHNIAGDHHPSTCEICIAWEKKTNNPLTNIND